jgi:nucleoside phosphorylase
MPYLDADAASLQRSLGLGDADLPDAAVLDGVWSARSAWDRLRRLAPNVREVSERIGLVDVDGCRVWYVFVLGGAMAATHAHHAAVLGSRAMLQIGTYGGLEADGAVGDVLLPTQVTGRDGVSRQLSRNRPITPDADARAALKTRLLAAGVGARDGLLVSTTTMALERPRDIRRWMRAGYAGVEMEAAATLSMAEHFGVPAAGGFVLIDNVGSGHTVFDLTDEERARVTAAREAVVEASIFAAATIAGGAPAAGFT